MNYLGIDVSKSTSRCVILGDDGEKLIKSFTIRNDDQGFEKLSDKLKKLELDPENILIGAEATGIWWENLYLHLTDKGYKVIILNPHQTKKFREALRIKAKTDDLDAYVIAGLLRSKAYAASFIPEDIIQELREVTKLRYQLMKNRKNYQRQVFSLISLVFPEYAQTAIKNPFSKASTEILKKYPTAAHLASTRPIKIEKIVRRIQGNNFNIKEIKSLIETAKRSVYKGRAKKARGLNLNILLSHVEQLNESIAKLEVRMKELLSTKDDNDENNIMGSNLLTIPGVGPKTTAAMLSMVGKNGSAFKAAKQIVGHLGFFPKIHQSGETSRENKISHNGPKFFRWAMYMAAVACIKHNPQFKALYDKKVSQGKTKKQALVYVAKKLTQMCLSMLKSGEEYKPERVFMPA